MPLDRDTDMLLKPERQTPGTVAELALKPHWLLLWLLMVDLVVMVPEGRQAEGAEGWRGELRGADVG